MLIGRVLRYPHAISTQFEFCSPQHPLFSLAALCQFDYIRMVSLGPVYLSVTFRNFGGETGRWRLNQHLVPTDVANCLPAFQPSYILAARRSKQNAAQEVVLLPPSINPAKIPPPFMLAIAGIATDLLYFPCKLGDYLSHNIVPV